MPVLILGVVVVLLVSAVIFGLWQGRKTKGPEAGRNADRTPRKSS